MHKKGSLLLISLLHSIPATFFLYGEPFYAQGRFGWSAGQIAPAQALSGLCIALGSYVGGRIAHRTHPHKAIAIGLIGSILGTAFGWWSDVQGFGAAGLLLTMCVVSFVQIMVWPGVETALMEDEPPERVPHLVGLFNLTWSLGTATAFLLATPIMHDYGLRAIFALPILGFTINLLWLYFGVRANHPTQPKNTPIISEGDWAEGHPAKNFSSSPAKEFIRSNNRPSQHLWNTKERAAFRWLGWTANPFTYLAILVIITYNPTTRTRLGLSFAEASVWFSLWFYARTIAFEILRRWEWWHYRPYFLCLGFAAMMASFVSIVLAPSLPVLLIGQAVFGLSASLLYQSSLYYAMADSDARGEHGGFHECFIGIGSMLGPLLTWGSARFFPDHVRLPIVLVLALMTVGLVNLLIRSRQVKQLRLSAL